MARRRGNPNWGKVMVGFAHQLPTAFEQEVRRLGLNTQTFATSRELRRWCERNKDRCYIPEQLLKSWGISANGNWSE